MYFTLLAFPILGAGLKYIDDAFDERTFSIKFALILAPFLGILWAYAMVVDPIAATILLAILLGVLIRGKIDNYAHFIGLAVIIGILLFTGVDLLILPLVLIAAAALLDEVGNDIIDNNRKLYTDYRLSRRALAFFFDRRWFTKLAILYVVLLGLFPVYFFLAMILFDEAYLMVRIYSRSRPQLQPVPSV